MRLKLVFKYAFTNFLNVGNPVIIICYLKRLVYFINDTKNVTRFV